MSATREQDERDAFLTVTLPLLLGECVREGATWCRTHRSPWPTSQHWCDAMVEHDDLGDALIEAWEGRAPVPDTPESAAEKMRLGMKVARLLQGSRVEPEVSGA